MLILTLLGCEVNQLSQPFLVDRTRILGVQAEPAEPAPGDRVVFSSLSVDPAAGGVSAVTWLGCLIEDSSSIGCSPDFDAIEELLAVDVDSLPPQEQLAWFQDLQAAGFLGVEPDFPPSMTVPEDLLDGLTEDEQLEGKNYVLTISALPIGLDELEQTEDITDETIGEIGMKRLPVSLGTTPNHNPVVTRMMIDEEYELLDGDTLTVTHGQTYTIEPILSDDSIEDYVFLNKEGELEDRTEEPYFTFFTTHGSFDNPYGLSPFFETSWTAPVDVPDAPVTVWMVIRDRRGGMAWSTLHVVVE